MYLSPETYETLQKMRAKRRCENAYPRKLKNNPPKYWLAVSRLGLFVVGCYFYSSFWALEREGYLHLGFEFPVNISTF
jgi:hypothetical protein